MRWNSKFPEGRRRRDRKRDDGDARKHLRAAVGRIIELAKSLDILPEDSAAAAPQIPEADQTEEMRKQLADAQTREAHLRTQLDEANGDLEIAKAGLKAPNGVVEHVLGRPLAAEEAPATSLRFEEPPTTKITARIRSQKGTLDPKLRNRKFLSREHHAKNAKNGI